MHSLLHKSCTSSAPPFYFTSSTNSLLSNQATTKLRRSLAITTINPHLDQSKSEIMISIEFRVTFKLTIVNAGRLAWWIVRFYSFSQRCLSFVTNSEFIVVDKGMCVFMIFLQLIYNPLVLSLSSYSFAEYPPFIVVYEPRLCRLLTCIQPIGLISLAKTCL